jgi:hypothetical protein
VICAMALLVGVSPRWGCLMSAKAMLVDVSPLWGYVVCAMAG